MELDDLDRRRTMGENEGEDEEIERGDEGEVEEGGKRKRDDEIEEIEGKRKEERNMHKKYILKYPTPFIIFLIYNNNLIYYSKLNIISNIKFR